MSGTPAVLATYYRYQAAASCVFFTPIFYVYYEERAGLALSTILAVQSYYLAVRALCDLPLGALADHWSRPACLAAYALCLMAGAAALLVAPALATVVAAETLFALGGAFRSGADSAFLFDALQAAGRSDLYPQAESRAQAVIAVATGVTAVAGGLLAALDLRLPYIATVCAAAASAGFALAAARASPPPHRTTSIARLMRDAAGEARRSGAVRWVLALAAFAVVTSHVWYYLQQPYMRAVGVPLALFGVVFAAAKAVTAAVAAVAHRVDAALGPRAVTALIAVTSAFGLLAIALIATPAGAVLLLARGIVDGLWTPLTNVYMNRLVASRLRATMLSAQSLVARLALAATLALLGIGTARSGLPATLAAAGVVAAVAGALLALAGPARR